MFFNKYSFHTSDGLRAAPAARSKEQGADGGQGVASGRTIQAAKGDTIHRVSQQCEVATRISPGVRRWCSEDSDTEIHGEAATAAGAHSKRL